MQCQICHESRGRMRVHMDQYRMTMAQADQLEYYLYKVPGITDASVNDRTANAVIRYEGSREDVILALAAFDYETAEETPEESGRAILHEYEEHLAFHVLKRIFVRLLVPMPIRHALMPLKAIRYIAPGVKSLLSGKVDVSVLDATSITVSLLRKDYDTPSSVMFLLGLSEILEEWTHKKSVDDLARSMALNVDKVWFVTDDGTELLVPVQEVESGEKIRVRTGSVIPLDGIVVSGDAAVNQSSLTGESLPVSKSEGAYVYAGTVLEEGDIVIEVKSASGTGRYDRIVQMIEESQKLESESEVKAKLLADKLVPYSLAGTALTWLLTRNATRAVAVLMVDYSCALKLCMPITVLSAMRQASAAGIRVKGGKFLDAVAGANTIVFDKTGTLTASTPRVAKIVTFGDNDETEMLRLAACLEEHFPHSIANAVVEEAARRGIQHDEMHSKVEYVVAHGIVSHVGRRRVLIGSYHFVFEDEKCRVPKDEVDKFNAIEDEYSHLYLSIGKKLAAVICIEDPIREESGRVIRQLNELGIDTVMMTGDSDRTARAVADRLGIQRMYSEVLPEDKAQFVRDEKSRGRKVLMIGDGVNDTPALADADAAIAVSNGAAIAREIADITITEENLEKLLELREIAMATQERIRFNYRMIISVNTALILLGVFGIMTPATTAYLHNFSTLALSLHSMTDLPVKQRKHVSAETVQQPA